MASAAISGATTASIGLLLVEDVVLVVLNGLGV
jgi:hypothetical protein